MDSQKYQSLLSYLESSSRGFARNGMAFRLLDAYFEGAPLEDLRPFLESDDLDAQRSAAFIMSEMGSSGGALLDCALSLRLSPDSWIRCYSLDCIATCAPIEKPGAYGNLFLHLRHEMIVDRVQAMFLISNGDVGGFRSSRWVGARRNAKPEHKVGIELLVKGAKRIEDVTEPMTSASPLLRRYGGILARREIANHPHIGSPELFAHDEDLAYFYEYHIRPQLDS